MVGLTYRRERQGERETAAEDRDKPFVGVGQTVLRQVTAFKHHVDLYGFSWLEFVSSHGGLLGGPLTAAQSQYRTAMEHREIPARSWRASARAGWWSRILTAV
jgi:hypothetical protein